MPNRKTNFGTRSQSDTARALDLTRQAVQSLPPGARFTTTYEVRTWICPACKLPTPEGRERCKFCGEPRGES